MGFLRLLLAFTVLSYHSEAAGAIIFDPFAAVNSFLIISGFYTAFIIEKKYHSIKNFYLSRFLRIYPLYWLALGLTLLLGILKLQLNLGSNENAILHYFNYSSHLSGNIALIEGLNFLSRNLTLLLTKDYFGVQSNVAPGYLIVNPAWTLQIELLFYLLAPFILKIKKNFIIIFCLYFIAIYIVAVPYGLFYNWNLATSFIKYLFFFLLGIISYRYIYNRIQFKEYKKTTILLGFVFLVFIVFYRILPGMIVSHSFEKSLNYYLPFSIYIAFLFNYSKNFKIDKYIGELSYPIYITHMIIIKIYTGLNLPSMKFLNSLIIGFLALTASILLVKYFQTPIDNFRHKRLK